MYLYTLLTTKFILGQERVTYCKTRTKFRYNAGVSKGTPPAIDNLREESEVNKQAYHLLVFLWLENF